MLYAPSLVPRPHPKIPIFRMGPGNEATMLLDLSHAEPERNDLFIMIVCSRLIGPWVILCGLHAAS